MFEAANTSVRLPTNQELLAPVQLFGTWPDAPEVVEVAAQPTPPSNDVRARRAKVTSAILLGIDALEFIGRFDYKIDVSFPEDESVVKATLEKLRTKYEAIQSSLILLEGTSFTLVQRTLERELPDLVPRFNAAYRAAVSKFRELRRVIAFLLEEDDPEVEATFALPRLPDELPASSSRSCDFD